MKGINPMTNSKTKKLTTLGMLCAMAYTVTVIFTSAIPPIVTFPPLYFDPKDVVILLGGFLFGPLSALAISAIVSFFEMLSVSTTGWWGLLMNIVSSCSFVIPASFIYQKRKTLTAAILGLSVGIITVVTVMTLWNYIVVPYYTGFPREAVAAMLLPVFVPFNLFKAGLNSVIALVMFKPIVTALHKSDLIEPAIIGKRSTKAKWIFIIVMTYIAAVLLSYFIF